MIIKNCEGCRTYRDSETSELSACHYRPHAHTNHWCPCISCLVKSMCNTPCEAWGKYMDILEKFMEKFE